MSSPRRRRGRTPLLSGLAGACALGLLLAACELPVAPPPPCSPETCDGCCEGNVCREGTTLDACGAGSACVVCGAEQRCYRGKCINPPPGCGPSTCDGCCSGKQCVAGLSQDACGAGGQLCALCDLGELCGESGSCIADETGCGPQNCDGCCLDGECRDGWGEAACGTGGASCDTCFSGEVCDGTRCLEELGGCGPENCPNGCCRGGACIAGGSTTAACGAGGGACRTCVEGQVCTNGRCTEPAGACHALNCPDGCCRGGRCEDGKTLAACGTAGSVCRTCGEGERCEAGRCRSGLAACGPWNCAGCCEGDVCRTGGASSACGSGGAACVACGDGSRCAAAGCEATPPTCTASNCSGCCAGGVCHPGGFFGACGKGGALCDVCEEGEVCSAAGECVEDHSWEIPCGAQSCAGCCRDGYCEEGIERDACGRLGGLCLRCEREQSCQSGACAVTVPDCGSQSCAGCCDNGFCRAGTAEVACGARGAACRACRTGQSCAGGACEGTAAPCDASNCDGCCRDGVCLPGLFRSACGASGAGCVTCAVDRACRDGKCAAVPAAEWTILVYMSAENALEPFAVEDLKEMASIGSAERLNIVVLADRGGRHSQAAVPGVGAWDGAKLLRIEGEAVELADLGVVNMGDPATLRDFLGTALAAWPAQRTGLVMWNHGSAWRGFGLDDSADGDLLTLRELRGAIAAGLALAGRPQLDFIGFDASLMGSAEVAWELRGLASFLVALSSLMPGRGWDYRALAYAIRSSTGVLPPTDLARTIVQSYRERAVASGSGADTALAALDLSAAAHAALAADELGHALNRSMLTRADFLAAARAVAATPRLGFAPDLGPAALDLGRLAGELAGALPRAAGAAAAVAGAVSAAVIHPGAGEPGAPSGLSVFFPLRPEDQRPRYASTGFGALGGWMSFLQRYLGHVWLDADPVDPTQLELVTNPVEVALTGRVAGADLARTWIAIGLADRDSWDIALYSLLPATVGEGGAVSHAWDYRLHFLSDGSKLVPVALLPGPQDGEQQLRIAQVQYRAPQATAWETLTLHFAVDSEGGTGALLRAWSIRENGAGEVRLARGGQLRPLVPLVDSSARPPWVPLTDAAHLLTLGEEPLELVRRRVGPGTYVYGIATEDLAGNQAFRVLDVEVFAQGEGEVGDLCPNGHGDCASGFCLDDTTSGESECTQICSPAVPESCPLTTYCGTTEWEEVLQVCRVKLGLGEDCPLGDVQCRSGLCYVDPDQYATCVKPCTDDRECEENYICDPVAVGSERKGCIWGERDPPEEEEPE